MTSLSREFASSRATSAANEGLTTKIFTGSTRAFYGAQSASVGNLARHIRLSRPKIKPTAAKGLPCTEGDTLEFSPQPGRHVCSTCFFIANIYASKCNLGQCSQQNACSGRPSCRGSNTACTHSSNGKCRATTLIHFYSSPSRTHPP